MPKRVILEFPDDLSEKDLRDREVVEKGREGVVLELLRKGRVSQGKAAELLAISRQDLFDLMAKHDIPMANFSAADLEQQRRHARG